MGKYEDKANIIEICKKAKINIEKFLEENELGSLDQLPFCFGGRDEVANEACKEADCSYSKGCQLVTNLVLAGEDTDIKDRVFLRFRSLAKLSNPEATDEVIKMELDTLEAKIKKVKKPLGRGFAPKKEESKKVEKKADDFEEPEQLEIDEFAEIPEVSDEFEVAEVSTEEPKVKAKKPDMAEIDFELPTEVEVKEEVIKPAKKVAKEVVKEEIADEFEAVEEQATTAPIESAQEDVTDATDKVNVASTLTAELSKEIAEKAVSEVVEENLNGVISDTGMSLLPFNKLGYTIKFGRDEVGDTLLIAKPILDCACKGKVAQESTKPLIKESVTTENTRGSLFPAIRTFIETQSLDRNFSFQKVHKFLDKEQVAYTMETVLAALKSMSDLVLDYDKQMAKRKA